MCSRNVTSRRVASSSRTSRGVGRGWNVRSVPFRRHSSSRPRGAGAAASDTSPASPDLPPPPASLSLSLSKDIMAVAAPTTVSLAIEVGVVDSDRRLSLSLSLSLTRATRFARSFQPLAALISTAFVGHVLGHVALAGVGISLTVGIDLDRRAPCLSHSRCCASLAVRSPAVQQLYQAVEYAAACGRHQ